ncbi:MAG: ExbD/TolR family protein [Bacteriovoracia bacterium]
MGSRRIQGRRRRKTMQALDLDITSLLDILTILLVFLIQSYNASGVIINVPDGITLPRSASENQNTFGVNVQVSADKIWVDDVEVFNTAAMPEKVYDNDGRRIIALYNELVRVKENIKRTEKTSPDAKKFSGIANLVIDKTLKYNYVKRVMFTCADAGFKEFKFVVLTTK